jgi:hypothetical protein
MPRQISAVLSDLNMTGFLSLLAALNSRAAITFD